MAEHYKPVSDYKNLIPDINCIGALKGEVSQPFQLKEDKIGRIAIVGPCMFGLLDENDKKDWYGIFNHQVTIARYSSFLACECEKRGVKVDPQEILNGCLISHSGRRQWDEARWYPQVVKEIIGENQINYRANISSEELSVRLLEDKVKIKNAVIFVKNLWEIDNFDPNAFGALFTRYIDHRIGQDYESLNKRMSLLIYKSFVVDNNLSTPTQKDIEDLLIKIQKEQLNKDEADLEAEKTGIKDKSPRFLRSDVIQQITQDFSTERKLIDLGINPDNMSCTTVPQATWEIQIRERYWNHGK